MFNQPPEVIVSYIIVLFFGIGIHEYAHCKFADLAGDPTPRYYGRVTLNLFKHFEPVGTIMMVLSAFAGVGIGWGRPAPMDASKMRNPRWDLFIAVAAGPISNVCQAVIYAFCLRLLMAHQELLGSDQTQSLNIIHFLLIGLQVNLFLFVFNLIPFGPLDGHWLVGLLMPEKARFRYFRFNQSIGLGGLLIFVLVLQRIPAVQNVIYAPVEKLAELLIGR
jgi:Zn-dependent protease